MRDQILPQAQSQIDELAAQMAQSVSDQTTNGTPASVGSQTGFSVDTAGLLPGNSVQVTYTDALSTPHTVTIVRVDDPAALPLPNSATTNPNDQVVGVNFANGMASVVNQLNAVLGSNLQFSNAGTVLKVVNAPSLTSTVNAVAMTTTATALAAGNHAASPVHRRHHAQHRHDHGGRHAECRSRPGASRSTARCSRLLRRWSSFSPRPPVGDPSRPSFLLNQLTKATLSFSPASGVGTRGRPVQRDAVGFHEPDHRPAEPVRRCAAKNLQQGQDVVVNALAAALQQPTPGSISIPSCRI